MSKIVVQAIREMQGDGSIVAVFEVRCIRMASSQRRRNQKRKCNGEQLECKWT